MKRKMSLEEILVNTLLIVCTVVIGAQVYESTTPKTLETIIIK